LKDRAEDHWLHSVEKPPRCWNRAEADVDLAERARDQGRGQNECHAANY
jgi:hypothetical protein